MKGKLGLYKEVPRNGLVLFAGYQVSGDKKKMVSIDLEPFEMLNYGLYSCGARFETAVLREQLESRERYGFVIVDGDGFSFWVVSGESKERLYCWDKANLPKKHGRGGQSQNRFQRIRTEKRHNYLCKVAEAAVLHFIDQKTNMPTVKNIVVAGFASLKKELGKVLDPRLEAIICSYVDIQYGGMQGLREAISKSKTILESLEYLHEQEVVSSFFEEINKGSDLYTFGVVDTMYAFEAGAISTLIIHSQLEFTRYEILNTESGQTDVLYLNHDQPLPEYCEVLAEPVPLIEWIAENFESYNINLEIVSEASPEGHQFCSGFSGIGSLMIFSLDLPSQMDFDDYEDGSGDWEW